MVFGDQLLKLRNCFLIHVTLVAIDQLRVDVVPVGSPEKTFVPAGVPIVPVIPRRVGVFPVKRVRIVEPEMNPVPAAGLRQLGHRYLA